MDYGGGQDEILETADQLITFFLHKTQAKLSRKLFRFFPVKMATDNTNLDSSDSHLPAHSISQKQFSGSVTFWYGSGSADPYL